MANNKNNYFPITGSIENDLKKDIEYQVNVIKNTGKVKTLKNGDFCNQEIDKIIKDLEKTNKGKKFKINKER